MSSWLIERSTALLDRGETRRGFLTKTALVGTALAVAPVSYVLRPQTAYATICSCSGSSCNCTDLCCDRIHRVLLHDDGGQQLSARHRGRRLVEGRQLRIL